MQRDVKGAKTVWRKSTPPLKTETRKQTESTHLEIVLIANILYQGALPCSRKSIPLGIILLNLFRKAVVQQQQKKKNQKFQSPVLRPLSFPASAVIPEMPKSSLHGVAERNELLRLCLLRQAQPLFCILLFFLTETSPHLRISEKTSQSSLKGGRLRSFNNDGNTGETRHLTATPGVCRKQPSGVTSESPPPRPPPSRYTKTAACRVKAVMRLFMNHCESFLQRLTIFEKRATTPTFATARHVRGCGRAEQRCLIETLMKQPCQTRAIRAS